jgi:outer membrane immunogenic protein
MTSKLVQTSIALVAFIVASASAQAADMAPVLMKAPPKPAPSWTGFYVGGELGARFTDPTWSTTSWNAQGQQCALNLFCNPATPISINNYPLSTSATYGGIGFRAGGYVGYNWQIAPQWVTGIEGHFGWGNKTVSQAGVSPGPGELVADGFPPGIGDFTSIRTKWDASARARLGYLVTPDLLTYATGGVAWQAVELSASCAASCPFSFGPNAAPTLASASTTRGGFVVGGGMEARFWSNWFLRAEYTFASFGSFGVNYAFLTASNPPGTSYTTNLKLDTHTFITGLAYKFY